MNTSRSSLFSRQLPGSNGQTLREEIKEHKAKGKYSIVVVANKTDLTEDEKRAWAVIESVVCMDWEEKFVSSAKTGDNIEEVFQALES